MIKTLKGWNDSTAKDFTGYVNPGDQIDEEMYMHFLEVLPPASMKNDYFQVGSAMRCVDGKNTYMTFTHRNGKFVYIGECFYRSEENTQEAN